MAMQGLFEKESSDAERIPDRSPARVWMTRVLGFIGSAIVCWIVLTLIAPAFEGSEGIGWLDRLWAKIGITIVVALAMSALLSRIESTIWGKYYVIIGYLFSLVLVVWIVLRLFHVF